MHLAINVSVMSYSLPTIRSRDFVSDLMKTTEEIFVPLFGEGYQNGNLSSSTSFQEEDSKFWLELSMPGFCKKDVDLRLKDDTLTLEAQREARGGEKLKVSKRYYLPKGVEISKLSASLKNGILLIELPKVKEATPVSITIE